MVSSQYIEGIQWYKAIKWYDCVHIKKQHLSFIDDYIHLGVSINGGTPSYHPFLDGDFPLQTIQLLGYPYLWKPINQDLSLVSPNFYS